jgi:hypothetical protein
MSKVWPANGHRSGENNPHARLTWLDVIEIRMMAAAGIAHRVIAKRFCCDKTHVALIVKFKRWGVKA